MKKTSAFSLVEMLIYLGVLVIIFLVVVSTTLSFTSQYRVLSALRAADHAGTDALEPMSRAIRGAAGVTGAGTSLILSQTQGSNSTTTTFYLQNGTVDETVMVNGVQDAALSGPLTAADADITSLAFTRLFNTNASAVKIDMTVIGQSGSVTETKNFHDTIVFRGINS